MSNKLRKLPTGIQTFSQIIEEDRLYIDKTKHAFDLIDENKYVFLSRPRRFGKSLFLDTLHNIFEGNKGLFKGLYIYDKWDWETKYPVIKISFSGGIQDRQTFDLKLNDILFKNAKRLGITFEQSLTPDIFFAQLIRESFQKYNQKVVILIDEYDKPILDNIEHLEIAQEIRELLKGFYTQIKDNDEFIKFAMLTGVSKFSKVSIFSGLNNLTDISLDEDFGDICGYTQDDIESSFLPYLQGVNLEKLKTWYNGYNFLGTKVYNPFDILLFITKKHSYQNYWFETGTPSYLIKLIKNKKYFVPKLENIEVDANVANSFDIENINIETLLLQAGYLTIKNVINEFDMITYQLHFPNKEVTIAFNNSVSDLFLNVSQKIPIKREILTAMHRGEIDKVEPIISRLFASIAYNNFTNNDIANYEGFYASVLYAYFASLGLKLTAEDVTNQGRIDLTLQCNDYTYIFEFKMTGSDPLQQIKDKKYYEKYKGECYIIGILFDKSQKNIRAFEWQKI